MGRFVKRDCVLMATKEAPLASVKVSIFRPRNEEAYEAP
jgi:hypothetical protein